MPREAIDIAMDSIFSNTRSKYNNMFCKFVLYGQQMGSNVLLYNFSAVLVIGFFLSIYSNRSSIGSILLARAAIRYFWVLNSSGLSSLTDSEFVSKFMKGLNHQKKKYKPVRKAYPLSYTELEQLFFGVCQGGNFTDQPFIKQRFICMLILSFSSFTRFEEIQGLLVGQIILVDQDFSVQFHKGKTYLESRFGVIPYIPTRDFKTALFVCSLS